MRYAFVLFLDFDGVLHRGNTGTFRKLPILEGVLRRCPFVSVVLSTSWREAESLEDLKLYFSADLRDRVIDVTPISETQYRGVRQDEIEHWLSQHDVRSWIAVDDQPELFHPGCNWVYLTNPLEGLDHVDEVALEIVLKTR